MSLSNRIDRLSTIPIYEETDYNGELAIQIVIAEQLERIADALEKPGRVELDGGKLAESIIKAATRPATPWPVHPPEDQQ